MNENTPPLNFPKTPSIAESMRGYAKMLRYMAEAYDKQAAALEGLPSEKQIEVENIAHALACDKFRGFRQMDIDDKAYR